MASEYDRSTVPPEILGEEYGECIHGVPDGVECSECNFDHLKRDYDDLLNEHEKIVYYKNLTDLQHLTRVQSEMFSKIVRQSQELMEENHKLTRALEAALDMMTTYPAHGEKFKNTLEQVETALGLKRK